MNFKKFAKLFVLFSLMNLVGTVVWAEETIPCEAMSDGISKGPVSLPDATKDAKPDASGTKSATVG